MAECVGFVPPFISDAEIAWACDRLCLPNTAFSGPDGSDPRSAILKSTETLDVEACPGSGKTTLLVAKLAILARVWSASRRGICVLSHTNAARIGIEKRLGNTTVGQRLLRYPHFVGTIQAFVDEFLAIPWLRSLGFPVLSIDDDYCEQYRRRLLKGAAFKALAQYVSSAELNGGHEHLNIVSKWQVSSPDFNVRTGSGKPEFKDEGKPAAKQLRRLARSCVCDGYYRYREMFMWGNDLLDKVPGVRDAIRHRFPMVFIDEVQDNNEEQAGLLYRVFVRDGTPSIRQRFGDSNQAIYGYSQGKGPVTDAFPIKPYSEMPNSHRFGQEIATFAKPLGVVPQELVGCGPKADLVTSNTSGKHALFLFSDETAQSVLLTYAEYLCETFSPTELRIGNYTAVAAVHQPKATDMLPRCIRHYWPEYDPELVPTEPKPNTLYQYLTAGRRMADEKGEAYYVVEKLAEGIIRLARLCWPTTDLRPRKRNHRWLLDLLSEKPDAKRDYVGIARLLAVDRRVPDVDKWSSVWVPPIQGVAEAIVGKKISVTPEITAFLSLACGPAEAASTGNPRDNIYRYPEQDPLVRIRVGSIHSVKGETHTATLVLESYYKHHHLRTLKPWLLGDKQGKGKEGVENQSRLKQHYVAMTRPSHLLCLAMREDHFVPEELERMKIRGWRVGRVCKNIEWL